jgi:hypothetical protein
VEISLVKIRDHGINLECPICGTKTKPDATECPECGEILEDVLVLEEESGSGRISKWTFRIGLIIFLLGFLVTIYSFLHDGLGLHGIESFFPGYNKYSVFGQYNWLVVYSGVGIMIPGIILIVLSFLVNRWTGRRKNIIEAD